MTITHIIYEIYINPLVVSEPMVNTGLVEYNTSMVLVSKVFLTLWVR